MGKRKRLIERASDLRAETRQYGVRDIYELPVQVHWHHRAIRLQAVTTTTRGAELARG